MTREAKAPSSIDYNRASFSSSGSEREFAISQNVPPSRVEIRRKKKKVRKDGKLKKFLKTPKGMVFIILLVLMGLGEFHRGQLEGLINAGAALATGVLVDLLIGVIRRNKRILPDGAMVTALIVSLVLSANAPWDQAVIIMGLALFSKHVLVLNRKPIFNPAAFGLLVSLYMFHTNQSWWGGLSLLPAWALPLLFIGGFMIAKKVNKVPQVLTYYGVYFLLFVLITYYQIQDVSAIFRVPLVNTTLFLGFIMLTDPPTSPAKYRHQMVFGAIAAFVSVAVYLRFGGLSYPLIGLLTANAWKAWTFKTAKEKNKGIKKNKAVKKQKARI